MGLFEHFPYTNFHSLNIEWAIEKIKDLLQQGETLYEQLQQWKTDTDAELATWKTNTLHAIEEWEQTLTAALEQWKQGVDIDFAAYEEQFQTIKTACETYRNRAEAWAVGQIDGQDVPATDETYNNNAKYYAQQAAASALTLQIDNTLTKSNQAAEAKTAGNLIADALLSANLNPVSFQRLTEPSNWTTEQGINPANGYTETSAPKYTRTRWVSVTVPVVVLIDNTDYNWIVWGYTSESATTGTYTPLGTYTDNPVVIRPVSGTRYFRIGVCRKDGANLTTDYDDPTSDFYKIVNATKTFTLSDTTLSVAGAAADAKTVGDTALLFKGILASGTDLNTVTKAGIYLLSSDRVYSNAPASAGFLSVLTTGAICTQLFYQYGQALEYTGIIAKRDGTATLVNTDWHKINRLLPHKIAFFGDSIMWGRDGAGSASDRTTWQIPVMCAWTLGVVTINYGVSGQGYLPTTDSPATAYDNISSKDLSTYDTVVMCYGVNDGYHILGDYDSTDETEIMGQFNKIINYLYTQYPTVRIIVLAPFNGTNVGSYPDYWYGPRNNPPYVSRKDLSDTLKQACEYYWIPYIEQYDGPLTAKTITQYLPDGVHPNDAGYKAIGEWLAAKLRTLF